MGHAGLELTDIFLPLPPECWDLRHAQNKYMLETYAPYLSDDWREYFRLQHESESAFKNLDWDNPKNRPTLRAWGKKWGDFLDKYPNFIYASEFGEYVYELNSY